MPIKINPDAEFERNIFDEKELKQARSVVDSLMNNNRRCLSSIPKDDITADVKDTLAVYIAYQLRADNTSSKVLRLHFDEKKPLIEVANALDCSFTNTKRYVARLDKTLYAIASAITSNDAQFLNSVMLMFGADRELSNPKTLQHFSLNNLTAIGFDNAETDVVERIMNARGYSLNEENLAKDFNVVSLDVPASVVNTCVILKLYTAGQLSDYSKTGLNAFGEKIHEYDAKRLSRDFCKIKPALEKVGLEYHKPSIKKDKEGIGLE